MQSLWSTFHTVASIISALYCCCYIACSPFSHHPSRCRCCWFFLFCFHSTFRCFFSRLNLNSRMLLHQSKYEVTKYSYTKKSASNLWCIISQTHTYTFRRVSKNKKASKSEWCAMKTRMTKRKRMVKRAENRLKTRFICSNGGTQPGRAYVMLS